MDSEIIQLLILFKDPILSILAFSIEHWYASLFILVALYLVLMEIWIIARGKWWEALFKIVGGLAFIPLDVFTNLVCTLIYVDLPQAPLVTDRLQRYRKRGGVTDYGPNIILLTDWRFYSAVWICEKLLNPVQRRFDGTDHC